MLQAPDADAARRAAAEILSDSRFRTDSPPRPFKGVLESIGDGLRRVFEPVLGPIGDFLGGAVGLWLLAGLLVVVASLVSAALLTRRRTVRGAAGRKRDPGRRDVDPAELERAAFDAEARGDYATAVRLRFRAGVARLARAGVVEERPSATTGQLRRQVRAPEFADIAAAFDRIVYGGRPATAADASLALDGWRRLLAREAAG